MRITANRVVSRQPAKRHFNQLKIYVFLTTVGSVPLGEIFWIGEIFINNDHRRNSGARHRTPSSATAKRISKHALLFRTTANGSCLVKRKRPVFFGGLPVFLWDFNAVASCLVKGKQRELGVGSISAGTDVPIHSVTPATRLGLGHQQPEHVLFDVATIKPACWIGGRQRHNAQ